MAGTFPDGASRSVRAVAISDDGTSSTLGKLGNSPAGAIAVSGDQSVLVVPLISQNRLAVIDLGTGALRGSVATGIAPFGAAVNHDGSVAYVTNWGGRRAKAYGPHRAHRLLRAERTRSLSTIRESPRREPSRASTCAL